MPRKASNNINIKNYTSQVPAGRSVQKIEDCLVKHGAKNIIKLYDDNRKLIGIAFVIVVNNRDLSFKLPARIERIEKAMSVGSKKTTASTKTLEQAERTAWRLLAELIEIQMSLIHLDQMEFMEVFLPYMFDHSKNETFFDKMKNKDFAMLEHK
jgi:hypothetical protein